MAKYSEGFKKVDNTEPIYDDLRGDMNHENNAVRPQPKDWETRVDADDRGRGSEIRSVILEAIQPENASEQVGRALVQQAEANAAEIAAVFEGRKPLFHELLNDTAAPFAREIGRLGARGVTIDYFDGHVVVYRPDIVQKIIQRDPKFYLSSNESLREVIRRVVKSDQSGELMGYGIREMMEPGSVLVRIMNGSIVIAGFYAPSTQAEVFAEARLLDYERFIGHQLTAQINR